MFLAQHKGKDKRHIWVVFGCWIWIGKLKPMYCFLRPLVAAQHNSGVVDDAAVQRAVEQVALQRQTEARASHAMTHDLGHGEPVT